MISIILELVFKGIGYSLIMYALWLISGKYFYTTYIKTAIRKYRNIKRIRRLRELEREDKPEKQKTSIEEHLEILLSSVSNKAEVSTSNFIMFSFILFFVVTLMLNMLIGDMLFAWAVGIVVGAGPYMFLRYRLESIRLKTSQAFMDEFHIFLQNYQSTDKNIYYTLLNTVNDIENRGMKIQLRKLISSFQKERHDLDFKKSVHIFIYSINSTFAKRFGNLIIKAHLENVNIGSSLSDLSEDILQRKKDMEEESTENLQTVMLGFSPVIILPIMVWFAYQVSGALNFWYYFKQPVSITLFIICVILSVISIFLAFLVRKPKADM